MAIFLNRHKACLFVIACLFGGCLISPAVSQAANEAVRLNAIESQGRIRTALFLSERPEYIISSIDAKHILLTLKDTHKGSGFEKNIQTGTMIALNEDKNPDSLKVNIGLSNPYGKVDCYWDANKKLLYVDITPLESSNSATGTAVDAILLQDIKFGFTDKATRMVMRLNSYPDWDMDLSSSSRILMQLSDTSDGLKQQKYGTVKRLKGINIRRNGNKSVEISLVSDSSLNHVALFRMTGSGEDRLVLDIMDESAAIPEEILRSASRTESPAAAKGSTQAVTADAGSSGHVVRMKIAGAESPVNIPLPGAPESSPVSLPDKTSVNTPEPVSASEPEPKPEALQPSSPEEPAKVNDVREDTPVKIEPKLDDALPISSKMKKTIDGLKPGEAFLFGRIQQAMDIKDYEKGLALIDQFLEESPGSSLLESLMFLKGDFYYNLWKSGNNEALENVSSSYQSAIDLFPESESVPLSYIKMAQADSSRKNGEYMALGYLGLVLTQKKDKDLIPLAYLTRGKIFLKLNQSEKALTDFKTILDQYKRSDYAAEANFWIANYYHSAGLYEEAQKRLEAVESLDSYIYIEHPEYLFLRAKNCLYLKDYDCAREYLFKAVNIGRQQEGSDMLLTRIGDTYHNQENDAEAGKYYRLVVDYYPDTEGASIAKLRLASNSSDMTALDELGSGKAGESIGELAILQKGYQMYDQKLYSGVIDGMKQLIDKPIQTETRKSARSLYYNAADKEMERLYQLGKYKELTDLYESIQTPSSENISIDAILSAALAYNKIHLPEQAIPLFQKILVTELNPESRGAYYTGFAESYLESGNKSASRNLLEKARDNDLDAADKQRISKSLANLYLEENMLDDAYSICKTLMSGGKELPDDEMADVYVLAGKILNKQKRYDEAVQTLASTPGMPDKINSNVLASIYMELGDSYYYSEEYPKAVKSYESAFNLGYSADNKDYWNARFNLAQAYFDSGSEKKAKVILTEISEGGDTLLQQRAALKLGSMELEKQLQRLPMGKDQ